MCAEMFFFVTENEFLDFQTVASLGIVEVNLIGLITAISLALISKKITGWQRFQHLDALEVKFLAMERILVLAR